ncbi:MAG: amidohydrolase 2, partial [Acidimicrobiia bacterium]|nr:amidohydrolase 2 [Acidimicrobiia bacterium]
MSSLTSDVISGLNVRHQPIVIVSADSHIGPRLQDMRPYCPRERRDDYDAFAASMAPLEALQANFGGSNLDEPEAAVIGDQVRRMNLSDGGFDMPARLRDMDRDGISVELIFQGTESFCPLPFVGQGGTSLGRLGDAATLERSALGLHIYNRWLADACSIQPERHLGCALLPMWDVDAAIAELEWSRDVGLRVVNFPAPRRGIAFYDHPIWEPFWSACEDLDMVLATHAGAIDRDEVATPGPHEVFLR